jgi:hypothetical protein
MKAGQPNRVYWPLLILAALIAGGVLGSGIGPAASPALATTPYIDIGDPAGPLTHVYIGNDLSCQVAHTADGAVLELFPRDTIPGDCGTFLAVDGTLLYAPDFGNHGLTATSALGTYTRFTPVPGGQTPRTGTGTAGDPYMVQTVADATPSGIRITETDSYVIGQDSYRTDLAVTNNSGASKSVIVYRAGDCLLNRSDNGFGFATPAHTVACTENANNSPSGRFEEWLPITPASDHYEARFDNVWTKIATKMRLPNTCTCATRLDDGAAIDWALPLSAGGSVTLSHSTVFAASTPVGSIKICKETDPADLYGNAVFNFEGFVDDPTFPFSFTLTDSTLNGNKCHTVTPAASTAWYFAESQPLPPGWKLVNIVCTGGGIGGTTILIGSSGSFDPGDTGVLINMGSGQNVTCTFFNCLMTLDTNGDGILDTCAPPCVDPPPDMVAWWPLDEQTGAAAADIIGGHNGTTLPGPIGPIVATNGPAPANLWAPVGAAGGAKVGNALYFWNQSANRLVRVPDHPDLRFGTTNFSIDAWVFITQYSGTSIQPIVERMQYSGTTPVAGYRFYVEDGYLKFQIAPDSPPTVHFANTQMTQGVWHHVAVTVDRSSPSVAITLYVDGAIVSSPIAFVLGNIFNKTADLVIGGSLLGPAISYVDIAIDEVEIFSRPLTQPQIQSIYDAGSAGKCRPPVGGTVELHADGADPSALAAESSGRPVGDYASMAGGVAAIVVILAVSGWYGRRRWLR